MANRTVIGRHNTDITTMYIAMAMHWIGQLKVNILKDRLQKITPRTFYIYMYIRQKPICITVKY